MSRIKLLNGKGKKILKNWDTKIMTYVMLVVTAIVIIAAVVAWMTFQHTADLTDIGMTTASSDSIKVAVSSGGEDIDVLRGKGQNVSIDLNMPLFYEVESYSVQSEEKSRMAPGVYGNIIIYLTSLNEDINTYRIIPTVLLTYVDGTEDAIDGDGNLIRIDSETGKAVTGNQSGYMSEAEIEELRSLTKGHILFGEKGTNGSVTYSIGTAEITGKQELPWNSAKGVGEEKKVTVNWSWVYEYDKLPQDIRSRIAENSSSAGTSLPRTLFFEEERENSGVNYSKTQLYDYADTKIGAYVKSMKIHLEVVGCHE